MNLENELLFRLSLTTDFMESAWSNGVFAEQFEQHQKPSNIFHLTHNLQAASLFITLSEFLDRPKCLDIAKQTISRLVLFEDSWGNPSSDNELSFVVHDEKTLLIWNILVAIIQLKLKNFDQATSLAKTIEACIVDEKVSTTYPYDAENIISGWYAETMIGLLLVGIKTKNQEFVDSATYVGELLLRSGIVPNHFEAWAFSLLHSVSPDQRYIKRMKSQINESKKFSVSAMTSLFAGCLQQSLFASYPHDLFDKKLHMDILKQQISLQVDTDKKFGWPDKFSGAFILRRTRPNIRLDYCVQNAFAILHYLCHLRGQKTPAII